MIKTIVQWAQRMPKWVWLIVFLSLAACYAVIWPKNIAPDDQRDPRYIILRWFHSLAWLLLAGATAIRMTRLPHNQRIARAIELLVAPTYITFFVVLVQESSQ